LPARYIHVGQRGTPPDYGQTLCGKLAGCHTPLAEQLEQITCLTCRRRLQAGWLRWQDVPRGD
jgi:hypothetical protein